MKANQPKTAQTSVNSERKPTYFVEKFKLWHNRSKANATLGRVEHHLLNDIGFSSLQIQQEVLEPLSGDE